MKKGENSTLKIGEKADAKDLRLYSLDNLNFVVKFASLHGAQEIQGVNRPQDESFWLWFKSAWLEFARTIMISSFGSHKTGKLHGLRILKILL